MSFGIAGGGQESVVITTSDNRGSIFLYAVEDNQLRLPVRNEIDYVIPNTMIRVTYRTLNGLVVHDSGNITCAEAIESEFLGIVQNGKGSIDLNVNVSMLDATVTKSGVLKLSGAADRAKILNTPRSLRRF